MSSGPGLNPTERMLRDRVQAVEAECVAERQRTGRRVRGRRAVLAQSWRSQPASHEPRRKLRPRVAAPSKWARIDALLRNRWQSGVHGAFGGCIPLSGSFGTTAAGRAWAIALAPLVAPALVVHCSDLVLPSLSIVIPAYNEAASIEASVRDGLEVGAAHAGALEVIVCNDALRDADPR